MVWNLVSIAFNLVYNESKLYNTLDYWSRDMSNFNFSEKDLELVSPPHFIYYFSRKTFLVLILLTDQVSLSDCLYFSRYWAICVLQLSVNQAVTSWNLKIPLSFWSSRFSTWPKREEDNLNIFRTKRAFEHHQRLSASKNCVRPESAPLKLFDLLVFYFFQFFISLLFDVFLLLLAIMSKHFY